MFAAGKQHYLAEGFLLQLRDTSETQPAAIALGKAQFSARIVKACCKCARRETRSLRPLRQANHKLLQSLIQMRKASETKLAATALDELQIPARKFMHTSMVGYHDHQYNVLPNCNAS